MRRGPSIDLARKAYYDRNPTIIAQYWDATLPSHPWTVRWTYTVPSNRRFMHQFNYESGSTAIAGAGNIAVSSEELSIDGGVTWRIVARIIHFSTANYVTEQSITAIFIADAGTRFRARSYSNDTVTHTHVVSMIGTEFDV